MPAQHLEALIGLADHREALGQSEHRALEIGAGLVAVEAGNSSVDGVETGACSMNITALGGIGVMNVLLKLLPVIGT